MHFNRAIACLFLACNKNKQVPNSENGVAK